MTKEQRIKAATEYANQFKGYTDQRRAIMDFLAGAEAEADGNWIELKTKDDLPKDNNDYWVVDKNGNVSVKSGFSILLFNTTHYQLISKPNPPINNKY